MADLMQSEDQYFNLNKKSNTSSKANEEKCTNTICKLFDFN